MGKKDWMAPLNRLASTVVDRLTAPSEDELASAAGAADEFKRWGNACEHLGLYRISTNCSDGIGTDGEFQITFNRDKIKKIIYPAVKAELKKRYYCWDWREEVILQRYYSKTFSLGTERILLGRDLWKVGYDCPLKQGFGSNFCDNYFWAITFAGQQIQSHYSRTQIANWYMRPVSAVPKSDIHFDDMIVFEEG